jgi:Asp-tRNA(Asn)/Glu-tRNA(Gln) amidotransferase A subunit family amidase
VTTLFRDAVDAFAARFSLAVTWMDPTDVFDEGDPDLDWFTVTSPEHVSAFGRAWVRQHMDEFHVATREFLGAGLAVSIDDYLAARRRRYLYVRRIDQLLADGGLLLTPTVAAEGWLADGRMNDAVDVHGLAPEVYSTALQNITGHPASPLDCRSLPSTIETRRCSTWRQSLSGSIPGDGRRPDTRLLTPNWTWGRPTASRTYVKHWRDVRASLVRDR